MILSTGQVLGIKKSDRSHRKIYLLDGREYLNVESLVTKFLKDEKLYSPNSNDFSLFTKISIYDLNLWNRFFFLPKKPKYEVNFDCSYLGEVTFHTVIKTEEDPMRIELKILHERLESLIVPLSRELWSVYY